MTSRTRVLVVDDERFFREAIRELLEAAGHPVATAATAADALEAAADPEVGVVVLDIQLPDRSGLEVLRALRERRPELRVVMLSAHTDQEYVLEALRLGACDYLAKPLHEEEMRLSVGRALEAYELARRFGALRGRLGALAGEVERLVAARAGEGGAGLAEDRAALAARLAEAAARLLGAGKTSVLLREPGGDRLAVAAAVGRKDLAELDPVPIGGGVAGRAVAQGQPIVVDDMPNDPRFGPGVPGRYESGAFAVLPLGAGGESFGALCATDRAGGARFADEDLAMLRLLALPLAPALDPSPPLAEALAVAEPPAEPAGASEDAALARAVCDAMTAEVEPERMLRAALGAVAGRLGAASVAVYLLDAASGRLRREAQCCEPARPEDRPELPRDAGLTALAYQSGEAIASEGAGADLRCDAAVDTPADGTPRPLWLLPLRFRGRCLGVCRVFGDAGFAGLPETTGALVAAALSAAVRNVLLYRSLVESIEEVAQVRREAGQRGA
ncbi:MAG: response regulator [Deltaproteobacteria bacterium]|nr:response regulator [Deltaproteobacteria bacterium]